MARSTTGQSRAPARHRLVTIGDSLSQGFMSGAIYRTDISFPCMIATAMGLGQREFLTPDFVGAGGLPLNLEHVLHKLGRWFGDRIHFLEGVPVTLALRELLDDIEDYWERGRGAAPLLERALYHNLAVWGFEVRDAFTLTEGLCG